MTYSNQNTKETVMKSTKNSKTSWIHRIGYVFMILLICTSVNLEATSDRPNKSDVPDKMKIIEIIVGHSTIVRTTFPSIRVAVTDPEVAGVKVLTPYDVLVQGTKVGSTDLIVWGEGEKEFQQSKVQVRLDTESYQQTLNDLFPHASLQVSGSGETLIIRGSLRSADEAVQLRDYLDKSEVTYVDMTGIAGVQQVQLQVRVAEASRTVLRSLGINATYTPHDFYGAVTVAPSSGTPLISELAIGPESVSNTFSSAVTLLAGVPRANLEVFLQALSENQYLKLLANPTLVALSGEDASFLAGGEYPIPVVQNSGGGGTSISVEYQEYGIRLNFRPIVLGDGSIRLYMAPEVSELTNVGAVVIEGFSIPALVTRKMHTTLELKSGQTFAMAGLIKNKSEATNSRVPGLGDLPILGPLFRSVRYQTNETELVVLVTASLVEPMSLAKTPPLPGFLHAIPDDWELYLDGRIESQEPAKIHPDDAAWLKQNGLDHLLGPGAWDSYFRAPPSSQADISMNSDPEDVNAQSLQGRVNPLDPVGLGSTDSTETEDTI